VVEHAVAVSILKTKTNQGTPVESS